MVLSQEGTPYDACLCISPNHGPYHVPTMFSTQEFYNQRSSTKLFGVLRWSHFLKRGTYEANCLAMESLEPCLPFRPRLAWPAIKNLLKTVLASPAMKILAERIFGQPSPQRPLFTGFGPAVQPWSFRKIILGSHFLEPGWSDRR